MQSPASLAKGPQLQGDVKDSSLRSSWRAGLSDLEGAMLGSEDSSFPSSSSDGVLGGGWGESWAIGDPTPLCSFLLPSSSWLPPSFSFLAV